MVCGFRRKKGDAGIVDSSEFFPAGARVRTASPEDAPVLAEIYRPYVAETAVSFEYEAPDAEAFAGRIRKTLERYPWLVYETSDGRILGYAYAAPFKQRQAYDWSAEVSVYVREDAHGRGVGKALYAELERILARQGVRNLYACITAPREENTRVTDASIRFHGAVGYRLIGSFCRCGNKFSEWYDMCWMEKMIGTHEGAPEPLIPFPELRDRANDAE